MTFIVKLAVKIKSQITKTLLRFKKETISSGPPASGMDRETVLRKISHVPFWWHRIEVGYGLVTPGHHGDIHHPTGDKNLLGNMRLPENLTGKSVLDIGAWDGFYSFEAERRGARRVLAIDNFYRGKQEGSGSQGFEVAKEILNSKVEFRKAGVYDLNPEEFGMFDVVLCLGVLYHLRHPLLGMERIYSVTKEMLILETHYDPYHLGKPLAVFYENNETNDDVTTWWGFNESGLLALLRAAGFKKPEVLHRYSDRIIVKAFK
jgi:tRNA (mo5U34)-methyltransferase